MSKWKLLTSWSLGSGDNWNFIAARHRGECSLFLGSPLIYVYVQISWLTQVVGQFED